METVVRLVHSYDVKARRILCGIAGQMNSTKHASGVTCRDCRSILAGEDAPIDREAALSSDAEDLTQGSERAEVRRDEPAQQAGSALH